MLPVAAALSFGLAPLHVGWLLHAKVRSRLILEPSLRSSAYSRTRSTPARLSGAATAETTSRVPVRQLAVNAKSSAARILSATSMGWPISAGNSWILSVSRLDSNTVDAVRSQRIIHCHRQAGFFTPELAHPRTFRMHAGSNLPSDCG